MSDTETDAKHEVQASEFRTVKLPKFLKEEQRMWFIMLEREFAAYNIKSEAVKCSAVLRNLDQDTMKIVLDLIEAPPEKSTYKDLKQALIERLARSDEANLRRLLSGLELGNRKPSELLREMMQLAGASVKENAVKTLWIQRLPTTLQDVLTIIDDAELDRLAKVADKTIERSSSEVAAISTPVAKDNMDADQRQNGEIAAINQRLSRIKMNLSRRGRNSWRHRSGSRRGRSKSKERNGLCYFHNKFGKETWKCRKPCSWTGPDEKDSGN